MAPVYTKAFEDINASEPSCDSVILWFQNNSKIVDYSISTSSLLSNAAGLFLAKHRLTSLSAVRGCTSSKSVIAVDVKTPSSPELPSPRRSCNASCIAAAALPNVRMYDILLARGVTGSISLLKYLIRRVRLLFSRITVWRLLQRSSTVALEFATSSKPIWSYTWPIKFSFWTSSWVKKTII